MEKRCSVAIAPYKSFFPTHRPDIKTLGFFLYFRNFNADFLRGGEIKWILVLSRSDVFYVYTLDNSISINLISSGSSEAWYVIVLSAISSLRT